VTTSTVIALLTLANLVAAARLVGAIFTNNGAILTNNKVFATNATGLASMARPGSGAAMVGTVGSGHVQPPAAAWRDSNP
jgi:hypothetical protein